MLSPSASIRLPELRPIFRPRAGDPMHVAFFASGSGGNLAAALAAQRALPGAFSIDLLVTDRPGIGAIALAREAGLPVLVHDFQAACGRAADHAGDAAAFARYRARAQAFHDRVRDELEAFERERGFRFDLAVLAYRRWIRGSLLAYFEERMINQHPGDLTVLEPGSSRRRFVGLHAVRDALEAGYRRTRTTTFLVRDNEDGGEILCQGPWTHYEEGAVDAPRAHAHEERQKRISDWPSLRFALEEIALGRFELCRAERHDDGNRVVAHAGARLPYGGIDLDADRDGHLRASE